jgi:hypothetical protein
MVILLQTHQHLLSATYKAVCFFHAETKTKFRMCPNIFVPQSVFAPDLPISGNHSPGFLSCMGALEHGRVPKRGNHGSEWDDWWYENKTPMPRGVTPRNLRVRLSQARLPVTAVKLFTMSIWH